MRVIDKSSALWSYLSPELQGLINDGESLQGHAVSHKDTISDFSYLVFPYSKAYEGFLKKFFLDLSLIKEDEYYSDDIRIGRILNPRFLKEESNVFDKICNAGLSDVHGKEIAERLWYLWRVGRNQVFHYFPHNFRRLTYEEAVSIISELVSGMELAISGCEIDAS